MRSGSGHLALSPVAVAPVWVLHQDDSTLAGMDSWNQGTHGRSGLIEKVKASLLNESEDEAVRIANGTLYGLAGAVWSKSEERAQKVARRLRTGQVDINGGRFNPLAPFGGYKKSGVGREIGPLALEEFFQLKAIQQ